MHETAQAVFTNRRKKAMTNLNEVKEQPAPTKSRRAKKWKELGKWGKTWRVALAVSPIWVVGIIILDDINEKNIEAAERLKDPVAYEKKLEMEKRASLIEGQFTAWGAHRELQRILKTKLVDPGSYEHIETTYNDAGTNLMVFMKYRSRNGFGGMVIGQINARVTIEGEIEMIF